MSLFEINFNNVCPDINSRQKPQQHMAINSHVALHTTITDINIVKKRKKNQGTTRSHARTLPPACPLGDASIRFKPGQRL